MTIWLLEQLNFEKRYEIFLAHQFHDCSWGRIQTWCDFCHWLALIYIGRCPSNQPKWNFRVKGATRPLKCETFTRNLSPKKVDFAKNFVLAKLLLVGPFRISVLSNKNGKACTCSDESERKSKSYFIALFMILFALNSNIGSKFLRYSLVKTFHHKMSWTPEIQWFSKNDISELFLSLNHDAASLVVD